MNKKVIRNILIILLIATFIGITVVSAETTVTTSGELNFCKYAGTRRALKAVGYAILITKILVPMILMVLVIKDFFGVIVSGKSEDLSKVTVSSIKRLIAGFIVFIIPTAIMGVYDILGYGDQGDFGYGLSGAAGEGL